SPAAVGRASRASMSAAMSAVLPALLRLLFPWEAADFFFGTELSAIAVLSSVSAVEVVAGGKSGRRFSTERATDFLVGAGSSSPASMIFLTGVLPIVTVRTVGLVLSSLASSTGSRFSPASFAAGGGTSVLTGCFALSALAATSSFASASSDESVL